MTQYAVYHPSSGEIVQVTINPNEDLSSYTRDDGAVYLDVGATVIDPAMDYVDTSGPVIASRPALNAVVDKTNVVADGVDAVTITSSQFPVDIAITGPTPYTGADADGVIVLTFDTAGTHTVLITPPFPYQPQEVSIVAA